MLKAGVAVVVVAPSAVEETAFDPVGCDLPIPNCPDMNTCAALAS